MWRGVGLVMRLLERIGGTLDVDSSNETLWTLVFAVPLPAGGSQAAA